MNIPRQQFSKDYKIRVLREIEAGKSIAQASREYEISQTTIAKWKKTYKVYGSQAFAGNGNSYTNEAKTAELERKIGQLTVENDLLKKLLAKLDKIDGSNPLKKSKY